MPTSIERKPNPKHEIQVRREAPEFEVLIEAMLVIRTGTEVPI
jgi:hypothetical protein